MFAEYRFSWNCAICHQVFRDRVAICSNCHKIFGILVTDWLQYVFGWITCHGRNLKPMLWSGINDSPGRFNLSLSHVAWQLLSFWNCLTLQHTASTHLKPIWKIPCDRRFNRQDIITQVNFLLWYSGWLVQLPLVQASFSSNFCLFSPAHFFLVWISPFFYWISTSSLMDWCIYHWCIKWDQIGLYLTLLSSSLGPITACCCLVQLIASEVMRNSIQTAFVSIENVPLISLGISFIDGGCMKCHLNMASG